MRSYLLGAGVLAAVCIASGQTPSQQAKQAPDPHSLVVVSMFMNVDRLPLADNQTPELRYLARPLP
jgi:hypothetical protein